MRIARICRNSRDAVGWPFAEALRRMLIVAPDFARRIDLPGVGPCPRPVDIDRSRTGFAALVALRVYSFAQGMVIDGEAEEDEVFIVLMRGEADLAVDAGGARVGNFALSIGQGPRAVYLPPLAAYQLTARADCDIVYARARPSATAWPEAAAFAPVGDRLEIAGHALGMDLSLAQASAGEAVADDGRRPERFVHVRSDGNGVATVGGAALANWYSAALGEGEDATLSVAGGSIDRLVVAASTYGDKGSVDEPR